MKKDIIISEYFYEDLLFTSCRYCIGHLSAFAMSMSPIIAREIGKMNTQFKLKLSDDIMCELMRGFEILVLYR